MNQEQLQRLIAQHTPKPRKKADGGIVTKLIVHAAKFATRLWRNQTGTYRLADGRWISSGLCRGSSDLIGYQVIVVKPEDVGRKLAVFVAIEAKSATGRATTEQVEFVRQVAFDGGRAQIVRSTRELEEALKR